MESDGECAQPRDFVSDSSNPSSPQSRKSPKKNLHASPSTSISSLGSTSSYAIPTGSPGDSYKYKYSSRNTLSKPQKIDFGKPSGLALNNNSGTARSYDYFSIEELLEMEQQIKESIKKKQSIQQQDIQQQSIQQQNNLTNALDCESQDSDKQYDGIDFFTRADELNNDLDEVIDQEEEYSQDLDNEIEKITNDTKGIDNISVEELQTYSEEELIKIYEEKLQKDEFVELRNIYEILQKNAKQEAMTDKQKLKAREDNYNRECSQSDNENTQMTTESCMSSATMMEDTITEIHKNNVIRKIEHKNRQDTVKTILDARYNKEINFDNIRAAVEEGKSTNEQMSRIWGNYIEGETFKDGHCCYLCGGELVNKDKEFVGLTFNKSLKPEIEHKLPAIEFYSKVHNIINREEYKNLFEEWHRFINNTDSHDLLEVYNSINCNETEEKKMNSKLDELCNIFKQENNKEENIDKFIFLIKINLIEFAYSHHTCNQVKSNNNLRKSANKYTDSIQEYLSNLKNVINKNNINMKDGQQMIGLIKSYKLQHEKNNILGSIENPKNAKRIESNMRLINSLIDDYTKLCNISSTRMIAESIRDMKTKITNKTKEKATSAKINKIQDKLKLTSNQINKIISELRNYKIQIEKNQKSQRSPRSTSDPKTKFIKLYTETEIERKNELIRQMNDIEPGTYNNFDEYVGYYNNNLKSNFPGVFGGPKSATGGKKSRRLRLKSNRKTKKKGRNSKK